MQPVFTPVEKKVPSNLTPEEVIAQLDKHVSDQGPSWSRRTKTPFKGKVDRDARRFEFRVTHLNGEHNSIPVWVEGEVQDNASGSTIQYSLGLKKSGRIVLVISLIMVMVGLTLAVLLSKGMADVDWGAKAGLIGGGSAVGVGLIYLLHSLKFKRESRRLEEYIRNCSISMPNH